MGSSSRPARPAPTVSDRATTPGRSRCTARPTGSGPRRWGRPRGVPRAGCATTSLRRALPGAAGRRHVDQGRREADLGRRHRARGRAPGAPGGRVFVPRHYVLALRGDGDGDGWRVYEPTSGRCGCWTTGPCAPGGWPRCWASTGCTRCCCRPEAAGAKLSYPTRRLDPVTSTPAARPDLPAQFVPGEVEAGLYARSVERGYFEADPKSDEPRSASSSRRPTSPAACTSATPSSTRSSTSWSAAAACRATTRCTCRAWTTPRSPCTRSWRGAGGRGHEPPRAGPRGVPGAHVGWKAEHGGAILSQMRRLGESVDWTRERFTMDEGSNRAVRTMFKRLYDDGLIYRAERMVNWSPALRSVLSDIEVEHKEVDGELVLDPLRRRGRRHRRRDHPRRDDAGRHRRRGAPNDERYRHLVGTEVELPLVGAASRSWPTTTSTRPSAPARSRSRRRTTPTTSRSAAGTACRCRRSWTRAGSSPARARSSTEWTGSRRAWRSARRSGRRAGCREKRPYRHSVGHSSRAPYEPIEPRLSLQWFIKVGPLAKAAGDAVREGRVTVHPKELEPRWFAWVDTCTTGASPGSCWWGHRIPVWYGPRR